MCNYKKYNSVIKLVDYLLKNMDDNHIPGAIYLDLSKAFDTLNFDILLSKLKFYGVIDAPLKLLYNYLRNRHQFVEFKNKNSDLKEILTGITHGSIFCPLFFSIYINDLIKSTNKFLLGERSCKSFNKIIEYIFIKI